jgi:signal transduction histidine kinase
VLPPALFLLWIAYVAHHGFTMDLQFLRQATIGARYTFGFAGGVLTAYGLITYSREIRHLSRSVAKRLSSAGGVFALYAIFAGVFSSSFTWFRLPVAVELLRGLSAVLITYFIVKALNIFDIETRRKIEQQFRRIVQAEKLTSLGQLAAGIAHEINSPLTNASLGIQTLKARFESVDADRGIVDKLDAVERNIDKASGIARELLLFSRQKEGEFLPINLNTVIRGALTLLEFKLKNVAVREDFGDIPDVMGDPGKLEQVFINVLANSVEAMPDGGRISISTGIDGKIVTVRVQDTGSGVPEEHLTQVFDPFFTTKEVGVGTGLGLSICYGIVTQHKGTIELASSPGRGTTVTVRLPAREGS